MGTLTGENKVNISELVDSFAEVREMRLAADKEASELRKQETELKQQIIQHLQNEHMTAVGGSKAVLTLTHKVKPTATDWSLIWRYINETKLFSLLHKRLTEEVVKELWDAGEVIPGVGAYDVYDVTISKPKVKV